MGNNKEENYKNNYQQSNKINENNIDNDKIIYLGNDKNQIFNKENDLNEKITNFHSTDSLNPFTIAIDMWQNYLNLWSNAYKQLSFKNSPMVNGEFLFMYWKSNSTK
jgi:hypothetical protein